MMTIPALPVARVDPAGHGVPPHGAPRARPRLTGSSLLAVICLAAIAMRSDAAPAAASAPRGAAVPAAATAPAATAAAAPAATAAADSAAIRRRDRDLTYVYFHDDHDTTMSGDTRNVERARQLRRGHEPLLWFRDGSQEFVIRDAATLQQIEALWKPLRELGQSMDRLGAQQ